ncbi:MAG TPA: pilus assembly protein TadG-related protein [Cellulomonadaceae bacterium]|nr:pilus assembly protein TadG-related protein [Cellulomonadaceae bacterium]
MATADRHDRWAGSRGQTLVLFALAIAMLLGMASVAIDVGRLWTQQRFMQNAADAAALAAAKSVSINAGNAGSTVATARQAAKDILAIDLAGSPVGVPIFTAAEPAVFNGTAQGSSLADGIAFFGDTAETTLLDDTASITSIHAVRVALRTNVAFLLGQAVGVAGVTAWVGSHVELTAAGSLMPVAVRRYIGGAGPNSPVPNPCPDTLTASGIFFDFAATTATDCQGAVDTTSPIGYGGRTPASPSSPGPAIQLVGQGASASSGGVSFRGFINLDVRNFADTTSRVYYNGLTAGTPPNSAKNLEAGWVTSGYPGPTFPGVTTPPDPNDQVGIMDGNSAGQIVKGITSRFRVGDVFLAALYDGSVKTIPAFYLAQQTAIPALTAGAPPLATAGAITITPSKSFTDSVALSVANKPPWLTIGFPPGDVTPNYPQGSTVSLTNVSAAAGTPATIDTVWLKGSDTLLPNNQFAPDFYLPMDVQVGSGTKDFSWSPTAPALAPTTWGNPVTFTLTLTAQGSADFTGGNAVTVSLDGTGTMFPAFPAGSYWFNGQQGTTSATVLMATPVTTGNGKNATTTYQGTTTLTVNTTLLGAQGTYPIPLLMTGTNSGSNQVVNHADILKVLASDTSSSSNYIDIIGFAAYQITALDANTVWGEAVSPVAASPDDPQLAIALRPRLQPW